MSVNSMRHGLYVICLVASLCAETLGHGAFLDRMACFDFCGLDEVLSDGPPLGVGCWPDGEKRQCVRSFLADPVRGLSPESLTLVTSLDVRRMYCLLAVMEASALAGERGRFLRHCEMFRELLRVADGYPDVLGSASSRLLRLKIGYVLAKVINDRRAGVLKLSPSDVRMALPMVAPPHMQGGKWGESYETFRRMLIVGAGLEEALRSTGSLPYSLDDVKCVEDGETRDFHGAKFSYRMKGSEWMIHSGGICQRKDTSPWNVFIPCVEQTGGIPTDEMWFASSYSAVRKELYLKGSVHDANPLYRCYMRGRVVYRGEGEVCAP